MKLAPHIKEHVVFPTHNARTTCCPPQETVTQLRSFLSSSPLEPSPVPSRGDLDEIFIVGVDSKCLESNKVYF